MRPLDGVKVIDFTQAFSGPFCTMQLADFGARVIKIERAGSGDQAREWTPIVNGNSGYFASCNRGKESLSLNLKDPQELEVAKKLIKDADIVVSNFKPGTMEKMGLGYEDLKKINPEIICAELSGYGTYGPMSSLPAYDNVIQGQSGVMEMTGFPDGNPVRVGPAIGDNFTGLNLAVGIAMAYYHKMKTGKGQKLELAMLDTLFGIIESPVLYQTMFGVESTRSGNFDATVAPYDVYKVKDGYFSIGVASEPMWPRFCKALGLEELIDNPQYLDNDKRAANYDQLKPIIDAIVIEKTKAELDKIFGEAGVPAAPVLSVDEVMEFPQLLARDMVVEMDDPGVGKFKCPGIPFKMSETPGAITTPAPLLGQDNHKILKELGYSDNEINQIDKKQVNLIA